MSKIRPFIGIDLIKVLIGLRGSGKSVMLQLIQEELLIAGAATNQFVSFDFEDMSNFYLCTAETLHNEICRRKEFMDLYQIVFPNMDSRDMFSKYLIVGGMPYLSNLRYEEEPCRQYLQGLYNSVVLKNVVKRNSIRDVDLPERIISYITANAGTTFSAAAVSKYLKSEGRTVVPETILNYIKACEEAFLFYRVKRQWALFFNQFYKINEDCLGKVSL